jgi:hypothetical protein
VKRSKAATSGPSESCEKGASEWPLNRVRIRAFCPSSRRDCGEIVADIELCSWIVFYASIIAAEAENRIPRSTSPK